MKTLLLVRHSQAQDAENGMKDYDRNLTNYGIQKTVQLAQELHKRSFKADFILTSSAVRAYTTAKILAEHLDYQVDNINSVEHLYEAPIRDLFEAIATLPDTSNNVIIVNHNPTISFLVESLNKKKDYINLQPCGAVCFWFDVENWNEIDLHSGEISWSKLQYV
jgi:phosphohistidine phosphatase